MDVYLLGPVRLHHEGRPVALGRRQEQRLFGLLALEAGRPVPVHRLIELLWHEPPATARGTIQTYVARLRAAIAGTGRRLATRGDGYALDVPRHEVDALHFADLVASAQHLTEPGARAGHLGAALGLWHGELLADVADDRLRQRVGAGLSELRQSAREQYADALLAAASYDESIAVLADAVEDQPTRERLTELLMTALARTGRQVEAVAAFRRIRDHLAEEYGLEPGDALVALHGRILRGEIDPPPSRPPAPRAATTVNASTVQPSSRAKPQTLPRDLPEFTGRHEMLSELRASVEKELRHSTAPVIVALDGMAGAGKTTLALRLVHGLSAEFPDGQLFLDFFGHNEHIPVDPNDALDTLLRQLGVAGDTIPATVEERAALWRATASGRRLALVIDDAVSTTQVTPLLPAGPGCLVTITSRRRLTGLHGAHSATVGELRDADALDLLRSVVGDRIVEDPLSAAQIVAICGSLPLALRLAAGRLVHRPSWSAADLVTHLSEAQRLCEVLSAEGRTIAASFDLSYRHLIPPDQAAFRLLGIHPDTTMTAAAAAAILRVSVDDAAASLDRLVDSNLAQEPLAGRIKLHNLLREHAIALAARDPASDATLSRLVDYYTASAVNASGTYRRGNILPVPLQGLSGRDGVEFDTLGAANAWITREYPTLVEVTQLASSNGMHRRVYELVRGLWWHHTATARYHDGLHAHALGLAAARALDDVDAQANMLNYRASCHFGLGDGEAALADLDTAIRLLGSTGHQELRSKIYGNMSFVSSHVGDLDKAYEQAEIAGRLVEKLPSCPAQRASVSLRAEVDLLMHRFDDAARIWRGQLDEGRRLDLPYMRGMALGSLGRVELKRGRYRLAIGLMLKATQLRGEQLDPRLAVSSRTALAAAYRGLGRHSDALRLHEAAFAAAGPVEDSAVLSEAHCGYGETLAALGDTAAASSEFRAAVGLARGPNARRQRADALFAWATCLPRTDPATAAEQLLEAACLYRALGVPEARAAADAWHAIEAHDRSAGPTGREQ